MNKYNIKNKHIWFDTRTKKVSYSKVHNPYILKFDSQAEFNFYIQLLGISKNQDLLIIREPKYPLPQGKTWKCDFKLIFQSSQLKTVQRELVGIEKRDIALPTASVYVEYKGVISTSAINIANKLSNNNNVLFCSDKRSAFNLSCGKIRHVHSTDTVLGAIRRCLKKF